MAPPPTPHVCWKSRRSVLRLLSRPPTMRACAVALAVLLLCVAVTAMPPVKRLIRTAGVRGTGRTAAQINPL